MIDKESADEEARIEGPAPVSRPFHAAGPWPLNAMLIRIQLKAVLIAACVAVSLVVAAGLHWNARTQSASAEFESVNQLMRGINTLRVISAESVYLSTPLALDQWQRQAKKLQLELQSLGDESRLHRAEFEAMASRLATVQSDFLRQAGQLGGATSAVPPTHPDKPEGIALSQRDRLVVTLLALTDELADSGRTLLAAELHDLRVAEKRLMQTALLLLLVLLGVLVFVWRLVRTEVLRPLLELSMGVQQVTAGDYSTRLRFSGSSEFGQLALSFDAMRERLQASLVQSSADADRRAGNAETVGDALREAQALLTTLNLHSIVSVADRAGRIIEVNDAFCTISGYSRAELIGNNHRIVNSSEQAREFWVEMWADISSGKPWRREVCNRAKNGTLYWVDTLVAPLLGADGRVEKYISIRTDISRSKADALKLLGSLSDSQALLSTLHQHSIVSVADRAGRITEVNDAFCAISGYSREELIGSNHRVVNSGEQADEFWVEMWDEISSGRPWRREVCNRAKNGSLYWVDTLVAPLQGADGLVEKFISIRTDISRSKADALKLRTALREGQALLNTLHLHAIVSVADRAGRITEVNDAFCGISGFSRAELIGANHRIVNSGQQSSEFWVEMWDDISNGRPWRREVCNRAKDGSFYWVDTVVAPLMGADGKVEKYISIRTDISAHKQAQLSLQAAKESADEANRSKSDFLANMSHELRTPMNAILGMLSLLLKTDLNKRQRDYSSKTQAAARSLLGLLNEILDFSKIEAGKMTLDPQPFRFDQLLRDLSVILAANLGAKKLEVLFDIDPALPRLLVGDAMRLQQVLINLSGNAIKFTAQGAVVLTVKVEQQHDAAVTLQIGVRDSGIGIAPENHARIFSGFSQAEASTTRRYGGTGLGVAISQRLVALMGGELQLQSALGEGSLFFFSLTLPLATAADLAQEAASERELAQASEPEQALALSAAEACGLCVLVVDDNPQAREVLGRMCAALGWAVDVAASGAEALQKIAAQAQAGQAYQALFIDWMMPDLDGWQTCQRVKALALSSPPLLIVMVSANDRELLAQRSPQEQAGLDGYLFKPVTRSMLWDAYMDARAAREPAQHAAKLLPAPVGRRLAGMRLLVVEDNPNNQQVAQELLEDEGATVQLAGNGQEGVDAIAASMSGPLAKPFDVVLMDLQMPVLDGLGASRKIRQELGLLTLPIVAMTANAMDSDRQACLAAGMNDHVGKPFELSALVKVLCRVSGRGLSPQQTPGDDAAGQPLAAELLALAGAAEVDLAVALHRIGGKRPVYQRMLRSFINDLAAMPAALIGHLEAAEFADAARLMHTLKGLAATLGMGPLSAQAAAAEKLVAGAEPLERKLVHACHLNQALLAAEAGLQGLHDGLLASIEAAAEAAVSRPEEASGKADLAEWRTGLHALSLHLQDADMAAMQDIEALSAQCRLLFGSTRPLQDLDEAVGSLDFERALTLCKALIEEAGP